MKLGRIPACVHHPRAWIGVAVLLTLLPQPAAAQKESFVRALADLTAALEGTYGDEGTQISPAIDRMSAALAAWDREIESTAAALRAAAQEESRLFVERRVSLGRMYAERGRFADALAELDAASRLAAQRADIHVLRGLVLQAWGKRSETIAAFQTAHAIDSKDPVITYSLFHAAAIAGDVTTARGAARALTSTYQRVLNEPRHRGAPFAHFALLQAGAGGPPLLPLALYSRAYQLLAQGNYENAITEFRTDARNDPLISDPAAGSALLNRAIGELRRGSLTTARTIIEQSDALRASSEAQRVLGLIYGAESQHDKSVEALTAAIRRSPHNERARVALSQVFASTGRQADAERILQETVEAYPDAALARWWLATTHERANKFDEARREFERTAAAAISGVSGLHAAIGRFTSGAADFPAAIDAFFRAVHANPNDARLHRLLAAALVHDDRPDEGFAEFVAALLIDSQDAEALTGIGQIQVNAERYTEAVETLQRVIGITPDSTEARYALATALVRLGRPQDAQEHFAHMEKVQRQLLADRRRSLSFDVLKEEAALRAAEGRFETAIELYEKALALNSQADVYRALAELYARVGRAFDAARARTLYEKTLQSNAAGSPAR